MPNKLSPIEIYTGLQLKKRRKYLKLRQHNIANLMQISSQQLSKYESGKDKIPPDRLYKLYEILNVTPNFFFEEELELSFSTAEDQNILLSYNNIKGQNVQITLKGKVSDVKFVQEEGKIL